MRCTMLYVVEAVCFTCQRSRFSSAPSQALSVTCMAGGCHASQQTELHPVPSRTRSPEPRAAEHANAVALGPGLGTLGPSSPLRSLGLGSHCFLPDAACFPTQFRHGHSGLTLQQVLALYVYIHTHTSHSVPSASCQVLLSLRCPLSHHTPRAWFSRNQRLAVPVSVSRRQWIAWFYCLFSAPHAVRPFSIIFKLYLKGRFTGVRRRRQRQKLPSIW